MSAPRVSAYVGLGANLGDPSAQVRAGIAALAELPATRLLRCSALYRTAPVGLQAQPDFINAVCALETALDPHALMRALLDIERRHGRVRAGDKGGPRVLDLDLLLYGEIILAAPDVTVPHPRLHERAFVLVPLVEIAPDLVVPGRGPVKRLLAACVGQWVERLES